MNRVLLCLLLLACGLRGETHTNLTYAPAPVDNPLKGIAGNTSLSTGSGGALSRFPHSLIYQGIPLSSIVVASNTYNWGPLETILAYATNDNYCTPGGSAAVVRFEIDDPNWPTSAIPAYVRSSGIWTTNYTGGTYWPDYTNTTLIDCLSNFIVAFAANYDGDPRIAFVEMGLVGCYGEWDCDNWCSKLLATHFIPMTTEQTLWLTWTNAMQKTKIVARYPSGPENGYDVPVYQTGNLSMGYYDDGFTTKTLPSDYTAAKPNSEYYYMLRWVLNTGYTNKWKQWPYGGETYYAQGAGIFSNNCPSCVIGIQTWSNCVSASHATWIHVPSVFYTNSYDYPGHYTNSLMGAYQLGYELWVQSMSQTNYTVYVTVTNTGVAPFYYDWTVQLAASTNGTSIAKTWNTTWTISSVVPGDGAVTYNYTLNDAPTPPYTLMMQAVNPMANGKVLRFANANEHATVTNWLTLGTIDPVSPTAPPFLMGVMQ